MSDLQTGDQVKLKSGGPVMTVQSVGSYPGNGIDEGANCTWFDAKHVRQQDVFDVRVLDKVE